MYAAFRWDSAKKEISFLFLSASQFQVRGGSPQKFKISSNADIDKAIDDFINELVSFKGGGRLEYHILSHAAPVAYTRGSSQYKPSGYSTYIENEFNLRTGKYPNWIKQGQYKSELKNVALKKFKNGLKDLNLWSYNQGAYAAHLWALALHCTKGTHKQELKKLWRTFKQATGTHVQIKQQFDKWYQQL